MINGLDFEKRVHALLKKMGFETEVTRASGDGGIDIIVHNREHITSGKYVIQCKDWSKPVGEPPVRDLYGVITAENANKGILITTSTFTTPALKFAEGKPLELIDGAKFYRLLAKYGMGGADSGTMSIEDDRIKELTEVLNANPENIFALKELADIYLLREDYDKANRVYEKLVPLKPSVETERLKNAYKGGLINYGVALTKLKRYEDALKIFKKDSLGLLNEGYLTHYLGMYDIALSIFQRIKSVGDETWDANIEKAYVQAQPDSPHLGALISRDGNDEWTVIPLGTALQKAKQDGKQDMYTPIFTAAMDIIKEFGESWPALRANIVTDQIPSISEDDEGTVSLSVDESIDTLRNRCYTVIAHSKDILNMTPVNSLQEAYREHVLRQITLVTMIYDSILKYMEFIDLNTSRRTWTANKIGLLECIDSSYSAINNKLLEYESLGEGFVEEENKLVVKLEEAINKEKTEWCEKLRKTLYSDCKNQKPPGQSGWLGRFFGR